MTRLEPWIEQALHDIFDCIVPRNFTGVVTTGLAARVCDERGCKFTLSVSSGWSKV